MIYVSAPPSHLFILMQIHTCVESRFQALIDAQYPPPKALPLPAPPAGRKRVRGKAASKKKGAAAPEGEEDNTQVGAEAVTPLEEGGGDIAGREGEEGPSDMATVPSGGPSTTLSNPGEPAMGGGSLLPTSYLSALIGQMALQGGPARMGMQVWI